MHAHGGTSDTHVLTQNIPASIFRARSFAEIKIARIMCARITTHNFHSSSNRIVLCVCIAAMASCQFKVILSTITD